MRNGEGDAVESAPHPLETIYVQLSQEAQPGDILRTAAASRKV